VTAKLTIHLPNLAANVRRAAHEAVLDAAAAITEEAKANAPVKTGFLRDSILMRAVAEARAEVKAYASYAVFQEFGTSKMAAQPFFTPAIETVRARASEIMAHRLKEAVR
jgi:HK97 gp10 family phage protein